MATVPITGAAGVACLAAAAGAKSWLRAHRRGGPATSADESVAPSASASHGGASLDPGHALALFDGATGLMVTVTGGGGSGGGTAHAPPAAVELRHVPAVDDSPGLELPAFPAEALFVVVAGGRGGGLGLRSVGYV